jgi:hypothetical protein
MPIAMGSDGTIHTVPAAIKKKEQKNNKVAGQERLSGEIPE